MPSLQAFFTGIYNFSFIVPSNLATGSYFAVIDLDHNNVVSEVREHDNTARRGGMIKVY